MKFTDIPEEDKKTAFLELMTQPIGPARWKALRTIMGKHNMSFEDAQKYQASKIVGIDLKDIKKLPNPKVSSSLGRPR